VPPGLSRLFNARGARSRPLQPRAACILALCALSGCTGRIDDAVAAYKPSDSDPSDAPGDPPQSANQAGSRANAAAGRAGASGEGSQQSPVSTAEPSSACPADGTVDPGRAPLRRLTRFEYNNTVRDLLGDTTQPAKALPSEEIGNGFGNDADAQSVSGLLAEQLSAVAEGIAQRATATTALTKLDPCATSLTADKEPACARTIVEKLATRAYRRPLVAGESDDLLTLYTSARAKAPFATALATSIEALLQMPDILYRIELGVADPVKPERRARSRT
jgi:hypothetical protein